VRALAHLGLLLVLAAPAAEAGELDLVYSGGFRGITRTPQRFELHERLRPELERAGIVVDRVDALHGVLAQGPYEVWPVDGTIPSALKYAAAGTPICDFGSLVETVRTPTERFLPRPGSPEIAVRDGRREQRWIQRCEAGGVRTVVLSPPAAPGAELLRLHAYSLRSGFRWVSGEHQWYQLSTPRREAGRRLGVIRRALRDGGLYVDSGDFVEPAGHADDVWMDARVAGFEVLGSLEPAALAVGAAELAAGLESFVFEALAHRLPYVATNWEMKELPFPRHRIVEVEVDGAPVRIAFLGLTDPSALEDVDVDGLELRDPVMAVNDEADALRTSADPPDLVVLLANARPTQQRRLRALMRGVDLFLGDPTMATYRVERMDTTLVDIGDAFKAAPITLPLDGIGHATIAWNGTRATNVAFEPLVAHSDAPSDDDLTRVATELQARRAGDRGGALIPAEDPLSGVSHQRWRKVACEAVAELLDADSVFIEGLTWYRETPGDLTALWIADRLRGDHVLELHRVDGDRYRRLLVALGDSTQMRCGALNYGSVHGRPIDPQRTYRVVTTSASRRHGRIGSLLARSSSDLVGHTPKFKPVPDGEGVLTLEEAVLRGLRAQESPDAVVALATRSATDKGLQALIRLRRLSFRLVRFQGTRNESFRSVPETSLSSPSSFTLGAEADLSFEAGSKDLQVDVRFRGAFTRFAVDGLPPQETADDWVVSSTIDVPFLALPPRGAAFVHPFVQLGFDSEFTPAITEAGAELPRQADLSFFGGIAMRVRGPSILREYRVGPVFNRDLARLEDKGLESGLRMILDVGGSPVPLGALLLLLDTDMQLWAPTEFDDETDLGMRYEAGFRVQVRVFRALHIGLFARGLFVTGRVEATEGWAATGTFGASLDLATAIRLDARPIIGRR